MIKHTIMFLVLVMGLMVVSLVGCSCGKDEMIVPEEERIITSNLVNLVPRTQYDDLSLKYNNLQNQCASLQVSLLEAQKALATSQSQVVGLTEAIKGYAGSQSDCSSDLTLAQETLASVRAMLMAQQSAYNGLHTAVVKVNDRKDPTVNSFTVGGQTVFYQVWDKWWAVVMVK